MHLKSLTLKGFKSFASATTLRFEPGITCVVGPNGSGKSNVVDAIAWVLGEQGAKALRGGKMEDVIFAGTAGRPPLGRAEVTLTIDNSDGALPIDYTEVSITRRMFRDGAQRVRDQRRRPAGCSTSRSCCPTPASAGRCTSSSARASSTRCCRPSPEDRRGFIEEAAGVLKHRKRKEKALRKLDAMQANLTRLTDLTGELRRQLKPLGRQAEVARRAAERAGRPARRPAAAARRRPGRAARRRWPGRSPTRARSGSGARWSSAELAAAQAREAELEAAIAADAPALARAQETWYRLSALEERFRGTAPARRGAAAAPVRASEDERPHRPRPGGAGGRGGRGPRRRRTRCGTRSSTTAAGWPRRSPSGRSWSARWPRPSGRWSPRPARSPTGGRGWPGSAGQVEAVRTRLGAKAEEIDRLAAAPAEARERAAAAQAEFDGAAGRGRRARRGRARAGRAARGRGRRATTRPRRGCAALGEAEREAERDRATWSAREEALALGLTRKDGAGALLAAGTGCPGCSARSPRC